MRTSPLLEVKHLRKTYRSSRHQECPVFNDVNFAIDSSTITALTGPSGAGKSTLLRCICDLERPDSGEIRFEGLPLTAIRKKLRTAPVQMIFQDPGSSLNPRFTAFEIVEEPLRILARGKHQSHRHIVSELMEVAGLAKSWLDRKAWQFSGGQRARLAIARALAVKPRLLILDESLSCLDVSVQGQIVNLLLDLQRLRGLSYLLVTHDQGLAAALTHRILVLEAGRLLDSQERPLHSHESTAEWQLAHALAYPI